MECLTTKSTLFFREKYLDKSNMNFLCLYGPQLSPTLSQPAPV